jgi:hypothetical protein
LDVPRKTEERNKLQTDNITYKTGTPNHFALTQLIPWYSFLEQMTVTQLVKKLLISFIGLKSSSP